MSESPRPSHRVRLAATAVLVLGALQVQVLSLPGGERFGEALEAFGARPWGLMGGVVLVGATWAFVWAATHRVRLAAGLALGFWAAFALANAAKLAALDLPLLPLDLHRTGDVAGVFHAGLLRPAGWLKPALLLLLAAPLALAVAALPTPRRGWRPRALAGAAAATFLASLFLPATNVFTQLPSLFPRLSWDSRATCDRNGFAVFLAMGCATAGPEEPPGYTEERVARIVAGLPPAAKPGELRPNVVVILSESFCDPTEIPGLAFDADPVPTFHRLRREFGRLDLVSPVYGGLTCNAELEVLTGFNMRFMPEPSAAWVDFARGPVPSLASILRAQGWRAVALHAIGGMHNSAQIQPLLGFEACIPATEWAFQDRVDTWRVTDDSVTREIVRRARDLPRPWLLSVNTMEGHAPYDAAKYPGETCAIRFTRAFSKDSQERLTAYVLGLRRADRALAALLESFRDTPAPTLVFFYGDHRPDLGDGLQAWLEAGLALDGTSSLPMRTVPAAVWNNFGKRLPEFDRPVGMFRVLPLLLDLAGVEKPPHVRLVEHVAARWPVVSTSGVFDGRGAPEPDADLADYRLMQYDLMFGRRLFETHR
ncbi:MAG: LTA synthase family protein [Planctomycetia bacterium]|nr:LTA synthase family protein [Planctomycetia bacterium]